MPKKKVEMPTTAEPKPTTRPVRLDLDPEVHDNLRIAAALNKTSMTAYAREAVERAVADELKKKGIA